MEELKEFLQETEYCDFSHPTIQKLAHEIADKYDNPKDKAVALFYWVRDNFPYRLGLWNRKASKTISEKEGTCTNKANLLIALLRANNIPAGYGVMKVNGQKYLGPALSPMFAKHVGKYSTHIYTLIYLNNKWIKIDPSDDIDLCNNLSHFSYTSIQVDWDGEHNAEVNLNKKYIMSDVFPIANIDNLISKKPKNAKGSKIKIINILLKALRKNGKSITTVNEIEPFYLNYLKTHHLFYYYFFITISYYKDLKIKIEKNKERKTASILEYLYKNIVL